MKRGGPAPAPAEEEAIGLLEETSDGKRAGDAGYALVDGQPVWLDHHEAPLAGGGGVDLCGGPTLETRAFVPIRASVAHAATSVNLTFAATVGCEGSFAVDDVEVRVR